MSFPGNDWLLLRDEPGMREPEHDEGYDDRDRCWQCGEAYPLDTCETIKGHTYCSDCAYEMRQS